MSSPFCQQKEGIVFQVHVRAMSNGTCKYFRPVFQESQLPLVFSLHQSDHLFGRLALRANQKMILQYFLLRMYVCSKIVKRLIISGIPSTGWTKQLSCRCQHEALNQLRNKDWSLSSVGDVHVRGACDPRASHSYSASSASGLVCDRPVRLRRSSGK